jgi:molybdate transport system ATP-binding protein
MGYVFQDGRLFPHLSVRNNLLYGQRRDAPDGVELATIVDLLELGPLLDRRPQNLSGGERQRVAVGRALLSDPRALLLDEPLTGLHAEARVQVLDYLRRLKRELRIFTVLVTHQADEVAALADEVVRLAAGRVVRHVAVDEFVARRASFGRTPAA